MAACDYYRFDDLLNHEEISLRNKVRKFMEKEVAPIIATVIFCTINKLLHYIYIQILCFIYVIYLSLQYWEKAEFPFHLIPKLASLNITGGIIKVVHHKIIIF